MSKTLYFVVGAAVGAAAGLVYDYLFSPARATKFDGSYRSRLDWALDEGEKAADLREQELRLEFEAAKVAPRLPKPEPLPEADATLPNPELRPPSP